MIVAGLANSMIISDIHDSDCKERFDTSHKIAESLLVAESDKLRPPEASLPSEREIRENRRNCNKAINEFLTLSDDFDNKSDFTKMEQCSKEIMAHVKALHFKFQSIILAFKKVDNKEKVEDYSKKVESLNTQYALVRNNYKDAEEKHCERLRKLEKRFKGTSKKKLIMRFSPIKYCCIKILWLFVF